MERAGRKAGRSEDRYRPNHHLVQSSRDKAGQTAKRKIAAKSRSVLSRPARHSKFNPLSLVAPKTKLALCAEENVKEVEIAGKDVKPCFRCDGPAIAASAGLPQPQPPKSSKYRTVDQMAGGGNG